MVADTAPALVRMRTKACQTSSGAGSGCAALLTAMIVVRSAVPDLLLSCVAELLASDEIEKPRITLGAYGYIVFSL